MKLVLYHHSNLVKTKGVLNRGISCYLPVKKCNDKLKLSKQLKRFIFTLFPFFHTEVMR